MPPATSSRVTESTTPGCGAPGASSLPTVGSMTFTATQPSCGHLPIAPVSQRAIRVASATGTRLTK
ncbi:MAG: hypothetical protein IPQ07_16910 [Myxococcales bacterium]|nr:hypothetical protein [Myxococcales bacterium]